MVDAEVMKRANDKMFKMPELKEGERYALVHGKYITFTSRDKRDVAVRAVLNPDCKWVVLKARKKGIIL